MTLLLAVLIATAPYFLPTYVERKLIPGLAREFNLSPTEVHVKRIGWWGTDIGPIRFSANNSPVIKFTHLKVDYSPLSLLQGEIRGIDLGGLVVEITKTSTGVSIAGLPLPSKATPPESGGDTLHIQNLLPIELGHFSISQSRLEINWNSHRYTIPFELTLQTKQIQQGNLTGHANIVVAGNPVILSASLDQKTNNAKITLDLKKLSLDSLTQFAHLPETLKLNGTADFNGWGTFNLEPFNLSGVSISGQFQNAQIAFPNGILENKAENREYSEPILFSVKGESLSRLQWSFAPFRIGSQVNLDVNGLTGNVSFIDGNWVMDGDIAMLIPHQKILENIDIKKDLNINGQVTAKGTDSEKSIDFKLLSQWGNSRIMPMEGQDLTSQHHSIDIKGRLQNGSLTTKGEFTAKEVELVLPEGRLSTPKLTIDSTLTLHPTHSGESSTMTANVTLPDINSNFGSTAAVFPNISVKASGKKEPHQMWQFNTRTRLSKGRITNSPNSLQAVNLSMDLPLSYPDAAATQTGKFKIASIQWKNRPLGGITGTLKQSPKGLDIALRHISKLFPGMRVIVNGAIEKGGVSIDAEIPLHHLDGEFDLGKIAPAAAGIQINGQVAGFANLTIDGTDTAGSGRFRFNQGQLRQESRSLLLDGINMEIQFKDLPQLMTPPQQRLHVDHLSLGDLEAKHLDVDFQVEGQKALQINKAEINWSQGTINTSSIRITPDMAAYSVTLICEGLHLANVLEQLGATEASGEGTVSGRIPIRWSKGHLSFDKGYLISTPGQTGTLQLTGTEKLLVGLPPGTPQHTQLDIATEALKDYIYKSAKLNLQSEADHLLLKLQLDGKPNKLLPFAYDQNLGQFKRVAGEGQADFKGISIDLNFKSPLNEIINYKDLFQPQ